MAEIKDLSRKMVKGDGTEVKRANVPDLSDNNNGTGGSQSVKYDRPAGK